MGDLGSFGAVCDASYQTFTGTVTPSVACAMIVGRTEELPNLHAIAAVVEVSKIKIEDGSAALVGGTPKVPCCVMLALLA